MKIEKYELPHGWASVFIILDFRLTLHNKEVTFGYFKGDPFDYSSL